MNIADDVNKQSSSLVLSNKSCVSTREDHHMHICSSATSTNMSLSISEPYYSTDVNCSVNSTQSTGM